ncbi:zeta toxin family protein [Cordyceps militaris CM01]|uniref:Zeta toxin family protein n=1 Tax=Cordyceps militaris (strain CM01) TaxID=983644 RepID=G3JMH9_CORMM|nr:zeta toxin family protein [Cordyceps militaris CM01]EGX90858.1 zeta toxin family protein [Cordyceps militaris CM01]
MPPPPDLSSYRLSDADSQRIFLEEILPAEFPVSGGAPSPSTRGQPLAVLAVGQTGAGKTRLAPALLQALSAVAPAPTHLIADTYKTYHPSYARLMQTAPQHASAATGPDARRWLAQAAREATARRVDVVLESACRHPDDFAELAALFRAAGYRVEVVVMAVPAALSRLGILARFYSRAPEAHSRGLPVRLTPTKVHEDAYAGLLRAAAWLDEDGAKADQVVVLRRGNLVAYGWERGGGEASTIEAAVERERCRPLTEVERRIALEDVQKLDEHEEAREQLEEVKGLLKPLIEDGAQDGTHSPLVPLVFAQKDGDERASNVLRLGYV